MPAYFIGKIQVTDPACYAEYMKATPEVIARYGGRFVVRGGKCVTLEGPEVTERVVIIEFPTLAAAQDFFNSEDYQKAKTLREGAAIAQFFAVEGIAVPVG
jgi:uncharacterized protein (DUF1330 family)